jgi:hypothetical protein
MKRFSILGPLAVLAFSLFSVSACSGAGGGGGCGPSEQELDDQAKAGATQITTTCGPGTHLVGTVCERNTTTGH